MERGRQGKSAGFLRRIHVSGLSADTTKVSLSGEKRHYICDVLRMVPGDPLLLFDGSGWEYRSSLIAIRPGTVEIAVEQRYRGNMESPAQILLAMGLLKAQKMDFVIQKASELGVQEILPVATQRTVPNLSALRAGERRARWEKIAREASRQCGRSVVTRISPVASYGQAILRAQGMDLSLLFSAQCPETLGNIHTPPSHTPLRILVLVGPEGGFSDLEERMAAEQGFVLVGLGPRILRAETASIVALGMVQFRFGDLGSHGTDRAG